MANEPEKKLEQLIHRELRQLPDLKAPSSIISSVRARLEARASLPWYQRPWFAWPVPLRLASGILTIALLSGLSFGMQRLLTAASTLTESTTFSTIVSATNAITNALILAARAINPLYLAGGVALVGLMYVSCVALGTVCYRIAWNNR